MLSTLRRFAAVGAAMDTWLPSGRRDRASRDLDPFPVWPPWRRVFSADDGTTGTTHPWAHHGLARQMVPTSPPR